MEAIDFLQTLVTQELCYGIKSVDTDLYDFGFGSGPNTKGFRKEKDLCTHALHATCRFKIIWRTADHRIEKYNEETTCEKFHSAVKRLIGLKVKRVALSDKNDLWIDFGDCWVVFATFENAEESWRFFTTGNSNPHLVASNTCLNFSG